jgi:hypothetical protein
MSNNDLSRIPPIEVRRQLRREVGFGCPVPGCGNPYLFWHHFNPTWQQQKHHNPKGMIALCGEHHAKADAGAFTIAQLQAFKQQSSNRIVEIKGQFDWMRYELLIVVGGNFYFRTPILYKRQTIIWFNRDEYGYLLLNIRMLTKSREPRVRIEDNFWITRGQPIDLESPPSGKLLSVLYSNGDMIKVEFFMINYIQDANKLYPDADFEKSNILFPVTAVEIQEAVGGTNIKFGPRGTTFGQNRLTNCFFFDSKLNID